MFEPGNIANLTEKEQIELQEKLEATIKQTANFLNQSEIEKIAKETGFVERESKITGTLFLCVFMFGVTIYGNPSLEQLIGLLGIYLKDITFSKQGLSQRICEQSVKFFEKILTISIKAIIPENLKIKIPNQFPRIMIWDSTEFQLPEALSEFFTGKGGSASTAGAKIHFCYNLLGHQWFYSITSATTSDKTMESKIIEQTQTGELVIQDLGYFKVEIFDALHKKNAYYLSRLRTDATVYLQNSLGEFVPFDLINWLKTAQFQRVEFDVFIHSKHNVFTPTRLIIEKLPDSVVNERRRKMHKEAESRGKQLSAEKIFFAAFNFYITNAPAVLLPASCCRFLYSIRWQIELVFKAWKSHLQIHKFVVKYRPERVETTILAKLIFVTITSNIIQLVTTSLWLFSHLEISYFRALRHFQTIGEKWFSLVLSSSVSSIFSLLQDAASFIKDHCFKIPQKGRVYPLQLLENISLTS